MKGARLASIALSVSLSALNNYSAAMPSNNTENRRILIIDDERPILLTLEALLGRHGYQPDTAATASYGLRRIKETSPALVLLDVKLPFVSGLEVLAWIREQGAFVGLPTIMFTTSNQDSDVKRAYAAGANAYIVKPANFEECTRLAGLIKQFWVESNVVPPIDLPANASTT